MSKISRLLKVDASLLPLQVGYQEQESTLCIGLDIAWFGGSKGDPSSRYDFLAVAYIDSHLSVKEVACVRVPLKNHDLAAEKTVERLIALAEKYKSDRIVLAIDAPLQAAPRRLPKREPISKKGTVERRACEHYLNCKRKSIDNAFGGAKGWHPNIQPGAPLAPRVEALLSELNHSFKLWTRESSQQRNLIIECFPAEAIWGAKRMGWFPDGVSSNQAKEYKKQRGKTLTAKGVTDLVEAILLPFGRVCTGNAWKSKIVDYALKTILEDSDSLWKDGDDYPGGKMLDDVVDSLICLATAISYSAGLAHVWQDLNQPLDGHIIGPGSMQELHTGVTSVSAPEGSNA